MEPYYIKQEPNMDICSDFEPSNEFNLKSEIFKSEEGSNYVFLNQSIKYEFYTDNYNEKKLLTDNNLNTIIKQEHDIIMDKEEDLTEDEDFELRLSDTSVEGEDDARNESIPDLRAITNKFKCTKINETPSEPHARREKTSSKVDKVAVNETPKRKRMKQTSLLSFLKLNESPSVETKKTPRSRKSRKVKPAKSIIDPVEMKKIRSAKVVLDRLPAMILHMYEDGTAEFINSHCAKCNKDFTVSSNSRCAHCSEAIVFRCGQCDKVYKTLSSVRYHLESQCLVRNEFKCSQCEFVSTTKDLLRKHEKTVHKRKANGPIKCEKCQIIFSNSHNLKRHQKLHCSKKDLLCCEACDFKTNNTIAFRVHRVTHGADRAGSVPIGKELLVQSYCTTCEKPMTKSRYVKKCYKCKTMLSFGCTKCHRMFVTKKEAQNHAKIHDKTTSHSCEKCSKEFSDLQNLKKHRKFCIVK